MNGEDLWMLATIIAVLTVFIPLIGIIITELGVAHKFKDMLPTERKLLSQEHSFIKDHLSQEHSSIRDDISHASKTIDALHTAFGNFTKENAVAEEAKKQKYKNLKKEQKDVVKSVEKLSDFSKLLMEQQERIIQLEQEIATLKRERIKSISKSQRKDQTIDYD